jgi:uncharacterized protein Yka (UPF0111/DUF47 family)
MRKGILLLMFCLGLGMATQAQTLSKKEANQLSKEVNKSIDKFATAVEKADWQKVQKVVDRTTKDVSQNIEQLLTIIEKVDFSKLIKTIDQAAEKLDENVDMIELQKRVEDMGAKIEKTFSEKKTR